MSIGRSLFILGLFVFSLFGCRQQLENKHIENKLAKIEIGSVFSLYDMNTRDKWDCLYIVTPYRYEVVNKQVDIPSRIKHFSLTEAHCVLVFVKNKEMVSYSVVPRNTVDFCDLNDNGDFNDDVIRIAAPNAVFELKERRKAVLLPTIPLSD